MVAPLTFLWAFAGVTLFFYWLATSGGSPWKTLLIVQLFAATGIAWLILKRHGLPALMGKEGLELKLRQLGLYNSYNDSYTRFNFSPQHALCGWLVAAVFYEMLWMRKAARGAVFIWAAGLFWSPLTGPGLLLVPLAALKRVPWHKYFEPVNLIGGGSLLALLAIYFQGRISLSDSGTIDGPIWKLSAGTGWILYYALFLVLHLSALLLIYLIDRKYRILGDLVPLFIASAVVLILLPLYKLGYCGDLLMQASGPGLLFVALAASRCLQSPQFALKRRLFAFLVVLCLPGAMYPVGRFCHNLLNNSNDLSYSNIVQKYPFENLAKLDDGDFHAGKQYLGHPESLASRWLLK
jgi:hypothetical protein